MQYILIIYLILALVFFWIPGWLARNRAPVLAFFQAGVFTFFLTMLPGLLHDGPLNKFIRWIPEIELEFIFVMDGLSMIFVLLISGIGALVFFYAWVYMRKYRDTGKFYFYLLVFTGAMTGLVLSGNLIQLFVFWELTSFLSYLLISFFHEKELARKAAFQSLFITVFGGLSMLAGILLLGGVIGSYSVAEWSNNADVLRNSPHYLPGLILILIGVFTKSAQFPFHFWLPGAMQAPTPVSSYLHSATMVKAGFFLLARLNPVLGGTSEWTYLVALVGLMTMLTGAYFAITSSDLKSILANTTINALGILILLMGIDTGLSIKAALLFLFVHALYKASLFMIGGLIEKKTGTRDVSQLGGLIRSMPVTFVITLLLAFSMAGLPPMLGFLGKELIYEAKIQLPGISSLILVLGMISNILMVTISLLFLKNIFLGESRNYGEVPDEKVGLYLVGPGALALLSLFFGLFPGLLGSTLIESALNVIVDEPIKVQLKLWHGFTDVFFLSLTTVAAGIGLFALILRRKNLLPAWKKLNDRIFPVLLTDVFSKVLEKFTEFSERKTRIIQHGYQRYYILVIVLFTALLLWYQVYMTWGWTLETGFSLQPFYISGLVLIIIFSTLFSTLSKSRITAIIAMGLMGYGISLIYLYYSAVDLAITQIMVETLIIAMFMLVMQRLPRFAKLSSRMTKFRDFMIALVFGSVMTVISLKAIQLEFHHPISDFFLENSLPGAFGRNVVNVILVDFRALDTLGEVVVLTIAAMGVFILINLKTKET